MIKNDELPWYHPRHKMLYSRTVQRSNAPPVVSPREIYDYLNQRIHGQDEAKRAVSLFVWKTLKGLKTNMMLIGPSGCGKTEMFRALSEWTMLIDRISIVDSSSLTLEGWKGEQKVSTLFDDPVVKAGKQCILVLDEIDKALYPKTSSDGSDYAKALQGELLKPLEGSFVLCGKGDTSFTVDTSHVNFALLGAFSIKADELAERAKSPAIGFGSNAADVLPYSNPIGQKELHEYGVMPEFLGRIQSIVNLQPMLEQDYLNMLSGCHSSVIRRLEDAYGINLHLTPQTCLKIANTAFTERLGVRGMENQIKNRIDTLLFEDCTQTEFEF